MARTVTVLQIMDRVRVVVDAVGDTDWLTAAQLQQFVDNAYTELVEILVKAEIYQFETAATITTTGTDTYALPADHYKTLAIDYQYATGRFVEVPELTFAERNRFTGIYDAPTASYACGWRLVGSNVVFSPTPPSGQTYKHRYVPAPANISAVATSTAVDGIAGWDELLVYLAAIQAGGREGAPEMKQWEERRDALLNRIAQMAVDRAPVLAIQDTRDDFYGNGWMPWRRGNW